MTLILKGRFWLDLPTPPSTPDVGREAFQFGPRSNLDSIVPFVGGLWVLICELSPFFDSEARQGFHDKAAKTYVLSTK